MRDKTYCCRSCAEGHAFGMCSAIPHRDTSSSRQGYGLLLFPLSSSHRQQRHQLVNPSRRSAQIPGSTEGPLQGHSCPEMHSPSPGGCLSSSSWLPGDNGVCTQGMPQGRLLHTITPSSLTQNFYLIEWANSKIPQSDEEKKKKKTPKTPKKSAICTETGMNISPWSALCSLGETKERSLFKKD